MTLLAQAVNRFGFSDFNQWFGEVVASTCGDGALTAGGENAKHNGTEALTRIWDPHTKKPRAFWDKFHRLNTAFANTFKQNTLITKMFSVLKRLEYLFAMGQGLSLDLAVAAFMNTRHLRHKAPCGHRSAGYSSGVPERFLQQFPAFYQVLLCRMEHCLQGRGSHSYDAIKEVLITLCSPDVVLCALAMTVIGDRIMRPIMMRSQDTMRTYVSNQMA